MQDIYRKPPEICKSLTIEEEEFITKDKGTFAEIYKGKIIGHFEKFGYRIRLAEVSDIEFINEFISRNYRKDELGDVSYYDLYRFVFYGHGVILENEKGDIKGCFFEIGYDSYDKISYLIRLVIDKDERGRGFGYNLSLFPSLYGMQRGSNINRGIFDYDNIHSIYIHLNKIGWAFDDFVSKYKELGSFFNATFPLSPEGLLCNRIDNAKLFEYIRNNKDNPKVKLIECHDKESIIEVFKEKDMNVVAVVPSGLIDKNNYFLALPL
ncbi:MAG: hypothetical protein A2X12_04850 [Bacteroidetes bacterium GWE2_29_8]|nr:MAG: hypothetical protein A2X12_04850 [Bacteroidetes bacterium GWE2_29_8]OFY24597.1 MAG: hypothetical protein A2X02_03285 [Bacteroidetes bacterium GWF2_29_10]